MEFDLNNKSGAWDKIAKEYKREIISPLTHAKNNPLWNDLEKIVTTHTTIADIGCGTGTFIKKAIRRYKLNHLYGIDFSSGMIEECKKIRCKNLTLYTSSMTELKKFQLSVDIALSINSLIMPDANMIHQSLSAIHASIRPGGHFLAILPSLTSIEEEYQYTYAKELKLLKSELKAIKETDKKLEASRIDFENGYYHTDDMVQKYYRAEEILTYFKEANFKNIEITRVIYKRGHSFNYGDDDLKGHPNMWDYYVRARV